MYLPALFLERGVYVRERADGLYAPGTYICYKLAVEIFIAATSAAITTAALFYGVALHGSWLYFYIVFTLSTATAISLGYLFSAASPSSLARTTPRTWPRISTSGALRSPTRR